MPMRRAMADASLQTAALPAARSIRPIVSGEEWAAATSYSGSGRLAVGHHSVAAFRLVPQVTGRCRRSVSSALRISPPISPIPRWFRSLTNTSDRGADQHRHHDASWPSVSPTRSPAAPCRSAASFAGIALVPLLAPSLLPGPGAGLSVRQSGHLQELAARAQHLRPDRHRHRRGVLRPPACGLII